VERLKESALRKGVLSQSAAAALSRDEALQLAFAPGLSTAGAVSDVSGRGVGMDVVKSNVSRLHGSVRIRTKSGVGTTVAVHLPLTLAISQSLLVTVGGATAAIPLVYVVETARLPWRDLSSVQGRLVMPFRGRVLPLVALSQVLESTSDDCSFKSCIRTPPSATQSRHIGSDSVRSQALLKTRDDRSLIRIVVARSGDQEIGLIVDTLVGEQEVVLKPLSAVLGDTVGISGATILGNGTVALVLDIASLIERGHIRAAQAMQSRGRDPDVP
jgi:two-component system chemotaxis sensor kinase CheA